ncbi:cohesin domain-containing protein [Cellulosimicrobium marinum]|uniref:cohesin domain-containing protein n=1 Tax=Cellulosimicrobium marinum TaxID=1638992 RepID=UPI001E2FF08D|nr:cohesin domain-containing protein [Cellulosimicrobium marinum]MCB7137439.1 cohesin domain-containing protein [Cellulosimicrobium marinum]
MTHAPTRRRARRRATLTGGLALAAGLLTAVSTGPAALAAPSVAELSVTAPESVEVGDTVEVTVAVTGAVDLYAVDLAVAYDADLVEPVADGATTPDGGFSDVVDDGTGTVAVAHTRLGSSPGLEGDVTLATLTFTAVAAGDATFDVPVVTFVGADSETQTAQDAGTATTAITAAPAPTAAPTDTSTDTAAPTDPATTAPVTDDDTTADPTSTATAGTGSGTGGPLASTGASVAAIVVAALLAVATGVGVLVARRRAVASR